MLKMTTRVHVILTGLLSAFTGLVIFLVAAMDFPFRGEVAIDAGAFAQVLETVMTPPR